jgi:hypothetical protein
MRSVGSGGRNRLVPSGFGRGCPRAGSAFALGFGSPPGSLSGVHTGRFKNCKVCRRGSAPGRDRIPNVRESGCAAMRRFGGSGRYRPGRGYCDILRIPGHGSARRYSSVECDGMRRFATPSPVARDGAPVAQCRGPGLPRVFRYVPLDRLRRPRPPLQWNGCRVCCVVFALSPIGRDFFQGTGPRSRCRCRNTRR